ncbi:TPA: hypothetical protein ACGQPR_001697 [Citrobacter amalonaticus]
MSNSMHVENVSEVEMHADNLAPIISDSQASTDLIFRFLDTKIKGEVILTLTEIFERELDMTEWTIFFPERPEHEVEINIIKK